MREWKIDLRLFDGDGGGGAGGDGGAAGAESAAGVPTAGQVLADGTQVDQRLAERMEKQRRRHPEKYNLGAAAQAVNQGAPQAMATQQQGAQAGDQTPQAKTPDEEFEELIKGKYKDQYQQRFQQGINDRFKNQANLQEQLDGLTPMLNALAKQRGIEAGNWQALSDSILDDDSLYEEEAEEAGMTVEAYKKFQAIKAEADAAKAREARNEQEQQIRNHLRGLVQQGEQMKAIFPDFDIQKELADARFRRMTSPEVGLTVEQAYYAIHHDELAPQAYSAGIQRARQQMSQSIMANASRPVEGAMQGNAAAANIAISPRNMSREQRQALKDRAARGEQITL